MTSAAFGVFSNALDGISRLKGIETHTKRMLEPTGWLSTLDGISRLKGIETRLLRQLLRLRLLLWMVFPA